MHGLGHPVGNNLLWEPKKSSIETIHYTSHDKTEHGKFKLEGVAAFEATFVHCLPTAIERLLSTVVAWKDMTTP